MDNGSSDDTKLVHAGRDPSLFEGAINPPVTHASTIIFPTVADLKATGLHIDHQATYGRRGTKVSFVLREALAELEGSHDCILTPSGIAANVAALLAFLHPGDHLLMTDSVYGPTRSFCNRFLKRMGIETTFYDPLIGADIAGLMQENTKVVFTESPGTQTFEVQDLPAIAAASHDADAVVLNDNTWASPLFFKPLSHGADVSIQAATKYIGGHSDLMMGTIATTEEAWSKVRMSVLELGYAVGPDDAYLAQRGLRTMGVRLRQHEKNAITLAHWFKAQPETERVLFPALEDDPGHALWKRDFEGASGLFGVLLREGIPEEAIAAMLDNMNLFSMGYSYGGYESLLIPTYPAGNRSATEWRHNGQLLRVHAGLEGVNDLIADLEAGFGRMRDAS